MTYHNLLDSLLAQTKLSKKTTNKQQKIVETAIKLFAEKGYANTSTSEIAKEAGVAEATIFRHYGTKDNLLLSVILPFIKESIPAIADEVIAEVMTDDVNGLEDFLRALVKNRIQFLQENREIFQIVVKEFLYKEELRNEILPHFSTTIVQHLSHVLGSYKKQWDLADLPSLRLMLTFLGGYFISRFLLLPNTFIDDEEREIDDVVQFMLNGLRKPKA